MFIKLTIKIDNVGTCGNVFFYPYPVICVLELVEMYFSIYELYGVMLYSHIKNVQPVLYVVARSGEHACFVLMQYVMDKKTHPKSHDSKYYILVTLE